ncbi:MAG TPA: efflux RND transporter periplasmic adaptor subunit [Steroidobacteraceae bacterium]|nr:efflux RND transporter periplasmic adaptor subunit [Steroidobacteraceae bacterium]
MIRSERKLPLRTAVVVLVLLACLFGSKAWLDHRAHAASAQPGAPAVTVSTARVTTTTWQQQIHAIANLVAVSGIELTPQLSGQVTGIYFESGDYVRKGQRLIQIDDSNQLAQLKSDEASAKLAQINYRRAEGLLKANATSQGSFDSAQAAYASANAAVANDRATLAKLALSAPFSGWMGVREVSLGQYLTPGTPVAALNVWDPLRVEFTVPQDEFALVQKGQEVQISVNAYPGKRFPAHVIALGSQVDPGTRNVTVDATVPNPGNLLRPGMFGEALLLAGEPHSVLVVPSVAMTYNTFGDYVYVIERKADKSGAPAAIAVATPVRAGATRGSVTEILSGLKAGQTVVTAGQVKLHNGMPVEIRNVPAGG